MKKSMYILLDSPIPINYYNRFSILFVCCQDGKYKYIIFYSGSKEKFKKQIKPFLNNYEEA